MTNNCGSSKYGHEKKKQKHQWKIRRVNRRNSQYTVGEKKDSTLHRAYGVKLPLLRAVWAGQGLILPLEK